MLRILVIERSLKNSKYKGVYWCKRRNKWIAQMRYQGQTFYLGQYESEYEAHKVWVTSAQDLYGDFFRQN